MIKLARKYSFDKYGKGRSTIITLNNSFHGRTMTTLTATGQDALPQLFLPLHRGLPLRRRPRPGEHAEAQAGDDVCAVMVELIQGEGGVLPAGQGLWSRPLAELCQEKDWLLLVDEVQTGIGRTGTLFAYQQFGIQPDVVSFAKGIAGGLPLGGILASEKCRDRTDPRHPWLHLRRPTPSPPPQAGPSWQTLDDAFLEEVQEKGQYLRTSIENHGQPLAGRCRSAWA